jgi:hypothetical protein
MGTNGRFPIEMPINRITVSPKGPTSLAQKSGNELKPVFPQKNIDPASKTSPSNIIFYSPWTMQIAIRTWRRE